MEKTGYTFHFLKVRQDNNYDGESLAYLTFKVTYHMTLSLYLITLKTYLLVIADSY